MNPRTDDFSHKDGVVTLLNHAYEATLQVAQSLLNNWAGCLWPWIELNLCKLAANPALGLKKIPELSLFDPLPRC